MAEHRSGLAFEPPHPGCYLRDIKDELGMTVEELAKHLGVGRAALSDLINARKKVTLEMAIRLGQAFQNGARFWYALQMNYDLWHEERKSRIRITPLKWDKEDIA
jgi:addiction module HigA family antidote